MRTPIIAGNWKLHKTVAEAKATVKELAALVADVKGSSMSAVHSSCGCG